MIIKAEEKNGGILDIEFSSVKNAEDYVTKMKLYWSNEPQTWTFYNLKTNIDKKQITLK